MTRLHSELSRLYGLDRTESPGAAATTAPLTRSLVLRCRRPNAWPALRPLWQGVQTELGWPAPAIVVDGVDAIELWFSFQEALPEEQALGLGQALCAQYQADAPPGRAPVLLQAGVTHHANMPPCERMPGQWSAFVAPDLAAVFADDPWLDMPPGEDAQADQLSRLRPVPTDDVAAAQLRWPTAAHPAERAPSASASTAMTAFTTRALVVAPHSRELASTASPSGLSTSTAHTLPGGHPQSARAFLQQVMNDASVPLQWRVEAAKALLPHEVQGWGGVSPASEPTPGA